jgi:hypothetical protein
MARTRLVKRVLRLAELDRKVFGELEAGGAWEQSKIADIYECVWWFQESYGTEVAYNVMHYIADQLAGQCIKEQPKPWQPSSPKPKRMNRRELVYKYTPKRQRIKSQQRRVKVRP